MNRLMQLLMDGHKKDELMDGNPDFCINHTV